jgi:hypothetical protein
MRARIVKINGKWWAYIPVRSRRRWNLELPHDPFLKWREAFEYVLRRLT